MPRKNTYKMQQVKGYFQSAPFDWATSPNVEPVLRNARWMFIVLACGHIKRDPWESYQNETGVRIKAMGYHLLAPETPRRVRCYQCVTGHQQCGVPKTLPPEIKLRAIDT